MTNYFIQLYKIYIILFSNNNSTCQTSYTVYHLFIKWMWILVIYTLTL